MAVNIYLAQGGQRAGQGRAASAAEPLRRVEAMYSACIPIGPSSVLRTCIHVGRGACARAYMSMQHLTRRLLAVPADAVEKLSMLVSLSMRP